MSDNAFSKRLAEMVERGDLMCVFNVNEDGEADGESLCAQLSDDFVALGIAARNRNVADAQSRGISDAH